MDMGQKKHTISRDIDYITESIALLQHLAMGKKYASLRESLHKKYANSIQEGRKVFELLEKVEAYAQKAFADDMAAVQYYFASYGSGNMSCAGKAALLWEEANCQKFQKFSEIADALGRLSEKEYCKAFGKCLQNIDNAILDEDKPAPTKEPFDVISRLMELDIDDGEKWKLQKIFFAQKEHQAKILPLLEKAEKCLRHFSEGLSSLTERFYHYWTDLFQKHSPVSYLHEMLEISLGENPLGFCLYPSLIMPNVSSIFVEIEDDGSYKQMDVYRFGILFGEGFCLRTNNAYTDDGYEAYLMQVLKLLADKSKFEILSYIRDKAAYGSQLAKHMNLTTATISHHMSALLNAGLVKMERIDTKVYYSSNKKALEEVLDYSKQVLLGNDTGKKSLT